MKQVHIAKFKVRLKPEHPMFWKGQLGIVAIYLLDDSVEPFARRAQGIIEQLSYEVIAEPGLFRVDCAPETGSPAARDACEQAMQEGFSILAHIFHEMDGDEDWLKALPFS